MAEKVPLGRVLRAGLARALERVGVELPEAAAGAAEQARATRDGVRTVSKLPFLGP